MPLDKTLKKVLLIGSGPIVIGQAAEFDYAGTQACRALRDEGIEIALINSNPATIMTDNKTADHIYIEPLTLTTVKRVIDKEKPDGILSGLGGQTGLTLCMQLAESGFLEERGIRLLGSSPETIKKAEDRQAFKDAMNGIGQPIIPSEVVETVEDALKFADKIGYPLIVRPAFTLGGTGGGMAYDKAGLTSIARNGIRVSPINQILVEKSVAGWKEIEFEVMRDNAGNSISVCSMENFDPVGIHTGDSIVIAPAVTLSDKEYQMLRFAALNIINSLEVCGGCNCQFALNPDSFEYAVIEVNPRVSRSSALASKATGYPIAKVATKIAIGYNLDEIKNEITKNTSAAFEPTLDYVAVKLPKWPFDKFAKAERKLGTQMKATGEVMALATTFEGALLKAVRGAEIGTDNLTSSFVSKRGDEEIREGIKTATDERIFVIYEAMKRGYTVDEIFELSKIDRWFLNKIKNILDLEALLSNTYHITEKRYMRAKRMGFTDRAIEQFVSRLNNDPNLPHNAPVYKMVDTCGGEFEAYTPYFYEEYVTKAAGAADEAADVIAKSNKERIVILGSGPIRIGQGIEFDYASVQAAAQVRKMGYEAIVINNNPETVSTDFDASDRLYFEPIAKESVMNVLENEKPIGVIASFAGGAGMKIAQTLSRRGVKIIGTSADSIDICEDRKRFDELLKSIGVKAPAGFGVFTKEEALKAANELGYPVLMRPSYVLGGQNMAIAYSDEDANSYMDIILQTKQKNPILIDKYLEGKEVELDAVCDGKDIFIPGIMEHVERTGIHSGDSVAVYPPFDLTEQTQNVLIAVTEKICVALNVRGIVNIQYVLSGGEIYVIEVNPRASRTVPFISKAAGVSIVDIATRAMLGEKLADMGFTSQIADKPDYVAVKVPVFSFEKLIDVDTQLGPEMKSTGEVMGIGKNYVEALFKGFLAAGYNMKKTGGVFITVMDHHKAEAADLARGFQDTGFDVYATEGTGEILQRGGIAHSTVKKISQQDHDNTLTLLESGKISYIVSTSPMGENLTRDSVTMRRKACLLGIPCLTSIDTAKAVLEIINSGYNEENTDIVDINDLKKER